MNIVKKYEPKEIEDFCFDEKYKKRINMFIEKGFLNIIIVGPHGSGKTMFLNSIINKYFKTKHSEKIDNTNIFRINNLKDCGISFYRNDVKNFCQMPSKEKKLLVVDDLEMIDKSIQVIFKYYMEKWGNNFFFVATTTNPHKINESLLAKIFQINIPKKTTSTLEYILDNICSKEKICITKEAKKYIAFQSNGSIKLLFAFLKKIYYLNEKITVSLLEDNFTIISKSEFINYFEACKARDYQKAFEIINGFFTKGYSICDIFDEMFRFVKESPNNIFQEEDKYKIIKLISKRMIILNTIHEENIEIYFFTKYIVDLFTDG